MTNMTVRSSVRATLLGLLLLSSTDCAFAEENGKTVTGAILYHTHHGEQGRGDGMFSKVLRTPPSDLSLLAHGNAGVFPEARVGECIDGVREVGAHGPRTMPVWGLIFQGRETIRKIVEHLREFQRS